MKILRLAFARSEGGSADLADGSGRRRDENEGDEEEDPSDDDGGGALTFVLECETHEGKGIADTLGAYLRAIVDSNDREVVSVQALNSAFEGQNDATTNGAGGEAIGGGVHDADAPSDDGDDDSGSIVDSGEVEEELFFERKREEAKLERELNEKIRSAKIESMSESEKAQ